MYGLVIWPENLSPAIEDLGFARMSSAIRNCSTVLPRHSHSIVQSCGTRKHWRGPRRWTRAPGPDPSTPIRSANGTSALTAGYLIGEPQWYMIVATSIRTQVSR